MEESSGNTVALVVDDNPGMRELCRDFLQKDGFRVETAANGYDAEERRGARDQLASVYAALGMCGRALPYDRQALRETPENVSARRRRVWCLLQERRFDEARAEAQRLGELAQDPLSQQIATAALELPGSSEAATAARIATLPLFWDDPLPLPDLIRLASF